MKLQFSVDKKNIKKHHKNKIYVLKVFDNKLKKNYFHQ